MNAIALQFPPDTAVCQQLFLDNEGYIIESNDRIFAAFKYKDRSVFEWLPFLESIFPILESLSLTDDELRFEKVFPEVHPLKGYYDFAFLKVELDARIITVWSLYDVTVPAIAKGFRQQQINEALLKIKDKEMPC